MKRSTSIKSFKGALAPCTEIGAVDTAGHAEQPSAGNERAAVCLPPRLKIWFVYGECVVPLMTAEPCSNGPHNYYPRMPKFSGSSKTKSQYNNENDCMTVISMMQTGENVAKRLTSLVKN